MDELSTSVQIFQLYIKFIFFYTLVLQYFKVQIFGKVHEHNYQTIFTILVQKMAHAKYNIYESI